MKEFSIIEKFANTVNWISRNLVWLGLGIGSLLLLKPALAEFNTILLLIVFESLALFLSGVATYAFTRINFVRNYFERDDSSLSVYELQASARVLAAIFLGVHLVVGLGVLGVYFVQIG